MADDNVVYPDLGSRSTSGGGGPTDGHGFILHLVDSKVSASEERIMRRMTEKTYAIESNLSEKITKVISRLDSQREPPPIWQIAGVVGAGIGIVIAIAAFSSDRFDGGISAGSIVDSAVKQISDKQNKKDATQDKKLDKILNALEVLNAQPKTSP